MRKHPPACAPAPGLAGSFVRAVGPRRGGHAGAGPRGGRWRPGAVLTALVALPLALPVGNAAFSATTGNAGNTLTADASFLTYPQNVAADAPRFQHRSEDVPSFSSDGTAADSSGNNRPGVYAGPTDGPATWWRFGEGSGGVVADSSGGANTGTMASGASFGTGVTGGGGSFDSIDDHVLGARGAVRTDRSFSAAAWVKITNTSTTRTAVAQEGDTVAGFLLQYRSGDGTWVFNLPNADSTAGGLRAVSPRPPVVNRWTHLAGVYDDEADQMRLFVDGLLVATVTRAVDWHATGSLVAARGKWNGASVDYWLGGLDDVRVYPRALSTAEVAEVYARPSAQWEFDENTGTSVADATGNGATGTLSASTLWTASGRTGSAALLDGVDDYVTGPVDTVHTTASFSVAGWVYLTGAATTHKTVFSQAGTSTSAFALRHELGGKWAFAGARTDVVSPTVDTALGETAPVLNTWVHLAGVYDAVQGQVRLYVNGRLEGSAEHATTFAAAGAPTVGRARRAGADTDYWAGRIDSFRTYPLALANDDVAALSTEPTAAYRFDEGSGATVADASGNNRTGTLVNGATWHSSGHVGPAGLFDGVDDVVTAPAPVATDSSFSVSAWVYLTDKGNYRTAVSQDGTGVSGFFLQYHMGDDRWIFNMPPTDGTTGTWSTAKSTTSPVVQRWTHLVGVYDDPNDVVRLYVNGALVGTAARTLEWAATGNLVLGAANFGGPRADFWSGRLDDVALYQRALTDAEVTTLHDYSPSISWPFDENAGTSTADVSGHGNTGTMVNGGWSSGTRTGSPSAANLNGVSTYVTSAASPVATNASFTVATWTYFNASASTRTLVSQPGIAGGSSSGFELKYEAAPVDRWRFVMTRTDGGIADIASSAAAPTAAAWSHLVVVYDDPADQLRLYVNGVLSGQATHSTEWSATGVLNVGRTRTSGAYGEFYSGTVDDLATYRRPLPSDEVARLYAGTTVALAPPVTHRPTMSAGVIGALQGGQQGQQLTTAVAFNGTTNAYNNTQIAAPGPVTFTTELWFRTTSTVGGQLIAYTSDKSGVTSASRDRMVYLDSANRLTFGVFTGGTVRVVRSPLAYNDGAWHHLVTSYGAAGLKLYVDGALVAANANYTSGANPPDSFAGYWRWGGGLLSGWHDPPTARYFTGTIDEVAVYSTQLSDQQVAWHYHANH